MNQAQLFIRWLEEQFTVGVDNEMIQGDNTIGLFKIINRPTVEINKNNSFYILTFSDDTQIKVQTHVENGIEEETTGIAG